MSRSLQNLLYKKFNKRASKGPVSLLKCLNAYRENVDPIHYGDLLKVYRDVVFKRFGTKGWSGKEKLHHLGYNCFLLSQGFNKDLIFVVEWFKLHSKQINEHVRFVCDIQEKILGSEYESALESADQFQSTHGWSFWILELTYFLVYRAKGGAGVRSLTKKIKEKAKGKIIGFAASLFADRLDDKYSIEAYFSRWKENFNKSIKTEKTRQYYNFRGLGWVPDGDVSLGHVLCSDFSNSLIDCYNSFVEAVASLVVSGRALPFAQEIVSVIDSLTLSGVEDFRLQKIRLLLKGGCTSLEVNDQIYPRAHALAEMFYSHEVNAFKNSLGGLGSVSNEFTDLANFIEKGVGAVKENERLQKFAFGLRFLPIGLSLQGFLRHVVEKDINKFSKQGWNSLLSPALFFEEILFFDRDALEVAAGLPAGIKSQSFSSASVKLNAILFEDKTPDDLGSLAPSVAFWLSCQLLSARRESECLHVLEYLEKVSLFWFRQSAKVRVLLSCSEFNPRNVVNLACSIINESAIAAYEYPLDQIFVSYEWGELKQADVVKVAIVSHYTNAMLPSPDEDILYICKMACKAIYENFDREALQGSVGDGVYDGAELLKGSSCAKEEVVTLFYHVWVEQNLTFLELMSSRDVMHERLDVLRMLIQLDPDNEQRYASAIMDLTLRDTMWEGLSHIEETRIFVNEAGITRWAEKEIRKDFDNWKSSYIYESRVTLINKMMQYDGSAGSESVEEFIDHELSEDCRLFLNMIDRLQEKFLFDPIDGLHCYLSARIRHGTMKNTFLGPIDEAGLLAVEGVLDEKVSKHLESIGQPELNEVVKPAIIELSESLIGLIDDALLNKVRLKTARQPNGYIEIVRDEVFYSKVIEMMGSKLEFHQFLASVYNLCWESMWPSLQQLSKYFEDEVQHKANEAFEYSISCIDVLGEASRSLSGSLTRIKSSTCQKCQVAAGWFNAENHIGDRIFTLSETVSIAAKASRNIYRRFNGEVVAVGGLDLEMPFSGVGMAAIVESLSTLFENCWKYSGLDEKKYKISVDVKRIEQLNVLKIVVINPLSALRLEELTNEKLEEIRSKLEIDGNVELIAGEGGSGLPKVSRLSRYLDRNIFPYPLDVCVENDCFKVVSYVPVHLRGGAYDVYNY